MKQALRHLLWYPGSSLSQPAEEASNDGPEAEATRRAPVPRTSQGVSLPTPSSLRSDLSYL